MTGVPVPVPGAVRPAGFPRMSLPFSLSIGRRRRRERSTQAQPGQASGHNQGNPHLLSPPVSAPLAAPLAAHPPATSYGNIQEWADNVPGSGNNSGGESAHQGTGDGNGGGKAGGHSKEGSQQTLLDPEGANQRGNEDGNEGGNQPGNEDGNEERNRPGNDDGGNEGVQPGNSGGNEAPNDNGNAGNDADFYRLGKRDTIKLWLLIRLENLLVKTHRARDKLALSLGAVSADWAMPANEQPPVPVLPEGTSSAGPSAPLLVPQM